MFKILVIILLVFGGVLYFYDDAIQIVDKDGSVDISIDKEKVGDRLDKIKDGVSNISTQGE